MFRLQFRMSLVLLMAATMAMAQTGAVPAIDDTTLANQYFAIAEKLATATQYDSSNVYYQMAAAIYQKVARQANAPRLWERYIACYNDLGNNFTFNRQFDEALTVLNHALETGLKFFGENHPSVARSYHRLGNVYKNVGDSEKMLVFWNKALAIRLKTLGENHPEVGRSYGNLSLAYAGDGDLSTSILYLEKALAIFLRAYGENHPDVARVYENLGSFYGYSDWEKSLACHNKALAIRKKVFGENHPELTGSYSNLGLYYLRKRDYAKALECYDKALELRQQRFGDSSLPAAEIYRELGVVYFNKRDYQRALDYFNRDLAIEQRLLSARQINVSLYHKLGKLFEAQKEHEKALWYYQKSLICQLPDFADTNVYVNPPLNQLYPSGGILNSLRYKGETFQQIGQRGSGDLKALQMALSTFQLAVDLVEKMRRSYKAEGSMLALGKDANAIYLKAINGALLVHAMTQNQEYQDLAFMFAEKSKAATLAQALQESRAKQFSGIPENWLEKEKRLRIDLTFAETELEKEKRKNDKQDEVKLRQYQDRYFALKNDYDQLIKRLEKTYPKYYGLKYKITTVSATDLQKSLDHQTAVLEYFLGDSAIFVFAVTNDDFATVVVKRESSFEARLSAFANSFRNVTSKTAYLENAAHLYQILLKPLEAQIASKSKWIIIPDGDIYQIPFEALLIENVAPAIAADYRALPYLLKQHEISYHYSATLLLQSYREPATASYANLFAGFAPVFSPKNKNGNLLMTDFNPTAVARPDASSYLVTRDGKTLDELQYSEKELHEISVRLQKRGRIYLNENASEENFKTNLKGYKFVHVATHGFINSENPKLSNLAFSQPQSNNAKEDGILYSAETYNLDLNADLLVLSACQTGAGQIVKGEGLMSLTRGFLYSGARNIVASLWKVYDQHTSQLMVEMYRQIAAGKNYSTALREAKLKMIVNAETAAPQSWAGFVLIGR